MKKKSYIINFLLIIGLTIFALWFALKDNFREVMHLLGNIKWYAFIFIIIYGLSYNLIIGLIYKILGKTYKAGYKYKEGVQVAFVGAFFSGVTPSATGGQFAQAYIMKQQGIKISNGASILWIDFIIYQSVMVAYSTILMILKFSYYYTEHSSFFLLVLIGYVVNSMVILLLYTMAKFPKIYKRLSSWVVKLLARLKVVKDPVATITKWNLQLESFTNEIQSIKQHKGMVVKCILLNVIRLTVLYSLPLFIAYTMGLNVGVDMLLDIITMSAFVNIANAFFPVPGASGGTEAAFMLIFSTLFATAEANSIMILWRFSTYHMIIFIGGITFVYLKQKYDKRNSTLINEEDYYEDRNL
ncbi:uncharacterized protein (TIRG00374 family) [Breznakia sp. PF5-3]|uniref:lysylphosphatidylglycerol synthase transmembrane domain-containing protein n=1 Tax=unclassified Breznakia TaxID=2623764 RepID=UPI002406CC55|nr:MULTISPECIES: lysylphosphatidylglycerol synthase transmembrane domain-containing protein [unclassified Breznakia]MDF9824002.1 uncharacterized protein (TIRG00374 family) [Breznakia sp. PM6-1]MDF9834801.1 uncharacterized protein (TIRG00374 family) [Breznakia sp. PF5-3]MDF9838120.1 uncharacterized protein (TIRG00374 family) [Breznakia sp. PFB2-8]MDF9860106.1 uncharacterized protein (TIRG00374 family) [Breznakia sp. PH5-24]